MKTLKNLFIISTLLCAFALSSMNAFAHCDTMNGPVITTAKDALDKGDTSFERLEDAVALDYDEAATQHLLLIRQELFEIRDLLSEVL